MHHVSRREFYLALCRVATDMSAHIRAIHPKPTSLSGHNNSKSATMFAEGSISHQQVTKCLELGLLVVREHH